LIGLPFMLFILRFWENKAGFRIDWAWWIRSVFLCCCKTFRGVAQWLSRHRKTRVRIPPGCKVFWGNHSIAVVYNRLAMHCVCADKDKREGEIKA
jgi:hypothetical protein